MGEERRYLVQTETISGLVTFLKCFGCGAILIMGEEVMQITFGTEAPIRLHETCAEQISAVINAYFVGEVAERMN